MAAALDRAARPGTTALELLDIDRECHELVWQAAENRFLTDTLDMLYAQSDRLWHMYLSDVDDMADAVAEHREILGALRDGDGERAAKLTEDHIRSFDAQIRTAVQRRLASPLAGS
jgi:DNA-binding GntR family transcriptional regulator